MNPFKTTVIVGPPGTGKTTDLLRRIEALLRAGQRPDRIAFVSFTRKASEEGRDRAMDQFSLTTDDLPNFRTLHSMAFRGLGLGRSRMLQKSHIKELGEMLGLDFGGSFSEDGDWTGMSSPDRMMFLENLARVTETPLKTLWEKSEEFEIDYRELERLSRGLAAFKTNRGLMDFTDILEKAVEKNVFPEIDYLFVDEAQDLSALQWRMVEKLSDMAGETVIAGDDMQGIYGWSGADVGRFVSLAGTVQVLETSYRIPRAVHDVAVSIERRIESGRVRRWNSRKEIGRVEHAQNIEDVDLSKGTWLLLVRNNYQISEMEDECLRQGVSFDSPNKSPLRTDSFRAVRTWELLRRGEEVDCEAAVNACKMLRPGSIDLKKLRVTQGDVSMATLVENFALTVREIWHEALMKIPIELRDYFLAARRRGEKLLGKPRVRVSTIHAAKGGEADNVAVATDMSRRCFTNMDVDPDAESRVFYVAVTRCREALTIIQPRTDMYYEI